MSDKRKPVGELEFYDLTLRTSKHMVDWTLYLKDEAGTIWSKPGTSFLYALEEEKQMTARDADSDLTDAEADEMFGTGPEEHQACERCGVTALPLHPSGLCPNCEGETNAKLRNGN
jgi:hypothetical protein